MTTWHDNPAIVCAVSLLLFAALAWLLLRQSSGHRLLSRTPFLIVTAGVLLFVAAIEIPEALRTPFERYLGHSIHSMVRVSDVEEENWDLLWGERCGTVFRYMILGSAILAIVNTFRRNAVWLNLSALFLTVGWVLFFVWSTVARVPF
jgi:uncharacterized membrane protein YraQ (UPF0718 family)